MKGKTKISFKLKKNDLRLKYYRNHFSDHPIIYYLLKDKLIVTLNVEIYIQTLKKIKKSNIDDDYIIDIKNNKILSELQKILDNFPYAKKVDLHLQECYPSLYYLISSNLKFLNKLSRPTKLICQNIFEGWDMLSDNPRVIYGGRSHIHTSFCSFQFDTNLEDLPELPKFINRKKDREEDYNNKLNVYYNLNKEKFLKAIPVFQEINRNPYDNEYLGKDYLFATCRGIYIPVLEGINIHLERESLIYVIDEIKDGTLFKFWLNNNSQKYLEDTKESFEKYLKNIKIEYSDEIGKKVYMAGDLNIFDKKIDILKENIKGCNVVKNEYLDWIITDIYLGREEIKNKNNLFL